MVGVFAPFLVRCAGEGGCKAAVNGDQGVKVDKNARASIHFQDLARDGARSSLCG